MSDTARFASSLRTELEFEDALRAGEGELTAGLGGARPDVVLAFVSHHHGPAIETLGPRLAQETGARIVLGCTGEGILGDDREIERGPALSLWAGVLPGTELTPFDVQARQDEQGTFVFTRVPDVGDRARASLLLFADPYSFPMSDYLEVLNTMLPGVPAIGGMASGGSGPGQNLLFDARGVVEGGALGLVVEGAIEVRTVVSQGCRPVGRPLVITACKGNVIQRLGGKSAIQALVETFGTLPPGDRELLQRAPFLGLALDATKSRFQRGDFLVRGLVGADNASGALAIGDDSIRPGMTVQFLVRDASSAGEDLAHLLREHGGGCPAAPSEVGALLFSCNGRGTRMFPAPHHDIRCLRTALDGPVPAAGFFALGEIGPVGGRNFLHGFTASVALFRQRSR
ncbi:MAG: FIST C-terminal domain-containing protein [Planctomycetes bacterium]|nr:FIST C-terminal domain-containing protein [Planctomycetota bacterium]